jgi:transcriptional regulator NrdR family protein
MTRVVKRSGAVESFNADKLIRSLKKASIDSDRNLDDMQNIIAPITNDIRRIAEQRETIDTKLIRSMVMEQLDNRASPVSFAWRKFEKRYKKDKV